MQAEITMLNFLKQVTLGELIVIAVVLYLFISARRSSKSKDKESLDSKEESKEEGEVS